jgi:hypothetical protein
MDNDIPKELPDEEQILKILENIENGVQPKDIAIKLLETLPNKDNETLVYILTKIIDLMYKMSEWW